MKGLETKQEATSHRLFIGGLFDDVAVKDIRNQFASFGQVGNVQIIQRKDENGKIIKTFCYMDIYATHASISKCVSLYSKSKWKGHEIKLQIAKESYLERLKREWKIKNGKDITNHDLVGYGPCKDYEDIQDKVSKMKAVVPGTRIANEPNWIIGKYGRPLPIVHLRHKNVKLLKFDPSKHCHQLKKIPDNKDEVESYVGDLSWSLAETNKNGGARNHHQKRKWEKAESDVIEKGGPMLDEFFEASKEETRNKIKRLRDNSSTTKSALNIELIESGECKEKIPEKKKGNGNEVAEKDHIALNDIKPIQCESIDSMQKKVMGLGESIVSQIARKAKKSFDNHNYLAQHNRSSGNALQREESFQNENLFTEYDKNQVSKSEALDIVDFEVSIDESQLSKNEEKFNEKGDDSSLGEQEALKIKETLSGVADESEPRTSKATIGLEGNSKGESCLSKHDKVFSEDDNEEIAEYFSHTRKRATFSKTEVNGRKKKLSEEKRLSSLSERKKAEMSQRSLVNLALKSENLSNKGSNHIQFESSDGESADAEDADIVDEDKKVTGTAAISWLGLEDNDDDDYDVNKHFQIKKQFEGSQGAELFKLHKKAALDERFKIDARFHDSGDDNENVSNDGEADTDHELTLEKSRALAILDELLGKRSNLIKRTGNTKEKMMNDVIRYDPLDDMHAKYENSVELPGENETGSLDLTTHETNAVGDKPYPEVATETYYDVSGDLKGLFGKTDTQTFGFLNDDESSNTATMHTFLGEETTITKKTIDASFHPFDDESDDEELPEENQAQMDTLDIDKISQSIDELFFFTEDDPRLRSNAVDCLSDFMRRDPMEELYRQLDANRERLRQDFKRKHKDAIRRLRKKQTLKNEEKQ